MDNKQQGGQQLQIEISPEVAQGKYANLAMIGHSRVEFVVDFAAILPGAAKATVNNRVILAPEHAKRLLAALQENVMRYEKDFGMIQIPGQGGRTATPFGNPKGDA